jgi:hypothetical protein
VYIITWRGETTNWRGYPTSTLAHHFTRVVEASAYMEVLSQQSHWANKEFRIVESDKFYRKSD